MNYGSVALLSLRSLCVWCKCVKEWEYFSMWGWTEIRRIESLSIFIHGPAWSKDSHPKFNRLQVMSCSLDSSQRPAPHNAAEFCPVHRLTRCTLTLHFKTTLFTMLEERKIDFRSLFLFKAARTCNMFVSPQKLQQYMRMKGKLFPSNLTSPKHLSHMQAEDSHTCTFSTASPLNNCYVFQQPHWKWSVCSNWLISRLTKELSGSNCSYQEHPFQFRQEASSLFKNKYINIVI